MYYHNILLNIYLIALLLLLSPTNINGFDWSTFSWDDNINDKEKSTQTYTGFSMADYSNPEHDSNELRGVGSASALAWSQPSGEHKELGSHDIDGDDATASVGGTLGGTIGGTMVHWESLLTYVSYGTIGGTTVH